MKNYLPLWLGLCLACVAFAQPPRGNIVGEQEIVFPGWIKDSFLEIAEDAKEAAAENKHVILYFHLNGCPYCAVMMKESFVEAPYVDYLRQHFSLIEINIKGDRDVAFDANTSLKEKDLAKHLKVYATPTILFLDTKGKPVLRLNGYRSREDFKHALDYVQGKHYATQTFVAYLQKAPKPKRYDFLPHPSFSNSKDLSGLPKEKVVALLFESTACVLCQDFHQRILANPEIKQALDKMSVVRLDTQGDTPLTGFDGKPTTPAALARQYAASYTPGLVFFDKGKEIGRIDGMLRTFHATMMIRYMAEKQYKTHARWLDFAKVEQEKVLKRGQEIDLWK